MGAFMAGMVDFHSAANTETYWISIRGIMSHQQQKSRCDVVK